MANIHFHIEGSTTAEIIAELRELLHAVDNVTTDMPAAAPAPGIATTREELARRIALFCSKGDARYTWRSHKAIIKEFCSEGDYGPQSVDNALAWGVDNGVLERYHGDNDTLYHDTYSDD